MEAGFPRPRLRARFVREADRITRSSPLHMLLPFHFRAFVVGHSGSALYVGRADFIRKSIIAVQSNPKRFGMFVFEFTDLYVSRLDHSHFVHPFSLSLAPRRWL